MRGVVEDRDPAGAAAAEADDDLVEPVAVDVAGCDVDAAAARPWTVKRICSQAPRFESTDAALARLEPPAIAGERAEPDDDALVGAREAA